MALSSDEPEHAVVADQDLEADGTHPTTIPRRVRELAEHLDGLLAVLREHASALWPMLIPLGALAAAQLQGNSGSQPSQCSYRRLSSP